MRVQSSLVITEEKASIMIARVKITGKDDRESEDDDNKTHHLVNVRSFFNSGDDDSDDDVADAGNSHNSCFAAQSLAYMWFELPPQV